MRRSPRQQTSAPPPLPIDVNAILAYPSYGWHVVPCYGLIDGACECWSGVNCKTPGKHPRAGAGWQNKTISDEDDLVEYWEQFPNSNVGVLLGPKNSIIDVEIDGPEAEDTARRCGLFDGFVTPTFVSARGDHRLFLWDERFYQIGKAKVTVGGLEFRLGAGDNASQSVFPPSMHASGQQRRWSPGLSPEECEPIPLPDAAWELIRPTHRKVSVALSLPDRKEIVGGVGEGHRHESAKQYIGSRVADVRSVRSADAIDRVWIDVLEWNERNNPPLSEEELKELFEWTINKERERRNGKSDVDEIAISPTVAVRPGTPRATASKLIVPLTVLAEGRPVDEVYLTSTKSGRSQAEKSIAMYAEDVASDHIDKALGQIIVQAREWLRTAAVTSEGDTVRDLVFNWIPDRFKLAYKTERGAWSEARQCEVTRSEFTSFTPVELVELCSEAIDCPKDEHGIVREGLLLKLVESSLKILWASIVSKLPVAEGDADLGSESIAATRFKQKIIETWTRLTTHQRSVTKEDGKEIEVAARASLASRVIAMHKETRFTERKWTRVQGGFDAWARLHITLDGEMVILLAQRYTLAGQLGIATNYENDQRTFRRLGIRYGVFNDANDDGGNLIVSDRLSNGTRLAILEVNLAREILAEPPEIEWNDANDD